jgi:hypothetical protein
VNRMLFFLMGLLALTLGSCHSSPRSEQSFDEICSLVAGKSTMEVEALLGPPDSKGETPLGEERWIWWDYTTLRGPQYSPDIRDKIVHLQITFSSPILPAGSGIPPSQWRVRNPLAVSYLISEAHR